MANTDSLDTILDSSPMNAEGSKAREGCPLTLWVPIETKRGYDTLQRMSGRQFSRTLKKLIETAIARKLEADAG